LLSGATCIHYAEETAEKGKPLECIALAEPLGTPGVQAICDVLVGRGVMRGGMEGAGGGAGGELSTSPP
jgi:hypothetical protein